MKAEQIIKEANNIRDKLIRDRRYLHSHPGTGFDIDDTLEYVKNELEHMGYKPQKCGRAGLVALAGGGKPGKVFLLRADMDALPIGEESGEEFAAPNGNMHACGHDMHTAMLLGAARILKAHEDEIEGCVKLMFQPAEEIFEGSRDMISDGILKNPEVAAALMIHVMAGMPFATGTIIVSAPGVGAPAADYFEIKVKGRGCHGSMPNTGVDPLTAAAHILIALQELHARELSMSDSAVLTIGTMNAGAAANVIPDVAVMGGSIRAFDEATREFIKKRMTEIAESVAKAFRAECYVSFGGGCPTLVNDAELSRCAYKYVSELLGEEYTLSVEKLKALSGDNQSSKAAGSEDFAYVSHEVPSIMLALAAGNVEKGYKHPQHHPRVKFDEEALASGSAVYAYTAIRWLMEH